MLTTRKRRGVRARVVRGRVLVSKTAMVAMGGTGFTGWVAGQVWLSAGTGAPQPTKPATVGVVDSQNVSLAITLSRSRLYRSGLYSPAFCSLILATPTY